MGSLSAKNFSALSDSVPLCRQFWKAGEYEVGSAFRPSTQTKIVYESIPNSFIQMQHLTSGLLVEGPEEGWHDLVKKGYIEYIDTEEEDTIMISMTINEIKLYIYLIIVDEGLPVTEWYEHSTVDHIGNNRVTNSSYSGTLSVISDIEEPMEANIETKTISKKRKKDGKIKRKDFDTTKGREMEERPNKPDAMAEHILLVNVDTSVKKKEKSKKYGKRKTKDLSTAGKMKSEEKHSEVSMKEVDEIVSVDEDCSRVMKSTWLPLF